MTARRLFVASMLVGALLLTCTSSVRAQTVYDSIGLPKVNPGDPASAVFTFDNNLIQVQFRCGANQWWYYARPNTSTNFTAYGPFPANGCQATYSSDGDSSDDILTEVVNAPLTATASNGQIITVQFANFTSDRDAGFRGAWHYDTIGGNARITVQ